MSALWPQATLHTRWPGPSGRRGDPTFDRLLAAGQRLGSDAVSHQRASRDAVVALVDRIAGTSSPSRRVILIGHSNAGPVLWLVPDARPGAVRAVVGLEPLGPTFADTPPSTPTAACPYGLTAIPMTYDPPVADPFTDLVRIVRAAASPDLADCTLQAEPPRRWPNLADLPTLVVTGEASYHARYDWGIVAFLRQVGVDAEHMPLGDVGLTGNGHFMFMETNSDAVAEKVEEWLRGKGS